MIRAVLAIVFLSGCVSLSEPSTFAACKAADIGTTAIALRSGFVEGNPIVASSLAHGYFPLIAVSFVIYKLLEQGNNPSMTTMASAVTCGAAGWNIGNLVSR